MSERTMRLATINSSDLSAVVYVEAMHLCGNYVVQCRLHTRVDGFLATDMFGGYQSTTIEPAPRYSAKKLSAIASTAMGLLSTQYDYERLIAKPGYAKLGFPLFAQVRAAA